MVDVSCFLWWILFEFEYTAEQTELVILSWPAEEVTLGYAPRSVLEGAVSCY